MQRYLLPDLLRTIAIIAMIVYHALFDLGYFWNVLRAPLGPLWTFSAHIIATVFLCTIGITYSCSSMSRSKTRKIRRIAEIACAALLVSIATYVIEPEAFVMFGILHLIAASVIILLLTERLSSWEMAIIGVIIIVCAPILQRITTASLWLVPLGMTNAGFATLDYYPLIPWCGIVFLGRAAGPTLLRWIPARYAPHDRWTSYVLFGRYPLSVYLLHQPILFGVLWMLWGAPRL
jgi:uncharacterized membrane protein